MRLIDTSTVYRQDAVEALKNAEPLVRDFGYYKAIETIRQLPSAKSERKKGEWLVTESIQDGQITWLNYKCSECGHHRDRKMNYCEVCGADMRGDKE